MKTFVRRGLEELCKIATSSSSISSRENEIIGIWSSLCGNTRKIAGHRFKSIQGTEANAREIDVTPQSICFGILGSIAAINASWGQVGADPGTLSNQHH